MKKLFKGLIYVLIITLFTSVISGVNTYSIDNSKRIQTALVSRDIVLNNNLE